LIPVVTVQSNMYYDTWSLECGNRSR